MERRQDGSAMLTAYHIRRRNKEKLIQRGIRMDEKTMVADALVGINGELKMFGDMIPQTENKELKQCLKQIRNQCEMSQEKMYDAARERSYYVPAEKATQAEIDHVISIVQANSRQACKKSDGLPGNKPEPLVPDSPFYKTYRSIALAAPSRSFDSVT